MDIFLKLKFIAYVYVVYKLIYYVSITWYRIPEMVNKYTIYTNVEMYYSKLSITSTDANQNE